MAGLLVILTSLVTGAFLFKKYFNAAQNKQIARIFYSAVALSSAGAIYHLFDLPYSEFIYHLSGITSIAMLLSSMLLFVRDLKFELFHYPFYMMFLPLILPVSYLLLYDVVIMRDILFVCAGIIPLLVTTLLINIYRKQGRESTLALALMGIVSLALLNRNLSVFPIQLPELELIVVGIGSLILFYLFLKTFKDEDFKNNTLIKS